MTSTAFAMNDKKPENLGFNPSFYKDSKWCHDTPGTVSDDQLINLFTQEEIMKVLPLLPVTPKTISLKVGQSVFLAGVARLDLLMGPVKEKWKDWPLILTLFSSDELPINVVDTSEADTFYQEALKSDSLKVPTSKNSQRLTDFPALSGTELDLYGISDQESSCDIVFSSIGWMAVTTRVTLTYKVKAWTPGGKGLYLRDPPFLPFAVNLKGRKIRGSSFYGNSSIFIP